MRFQELFFFKDNSEFLTGFSVYYNLKSRPVFFVLNVISQRSSFHRNIFCFPSQLGHFKVFNFAGSFQVLLPLETKYYFLNECACVNHFQILAKAQR